MNFLICGYYGYENAGDDLLLFKTIQLIKKRDPSAEISVLGGPALVDTQDYVTLPRFSLRKVHRKLKETDYLVFGGGNLFQDKTSLKSFLYYFAIFSLGLSTKTKCIMLANGIGPITSAIAASLFKPTLSLWHHISLRDPYSYNYAKELTDKAIMTTDLGFYNAIALKSGNEKSNRIALSYRSLLAKQTSVHGLRNFLTELGGRYTVDFWEFQKETDWQETTKLMKKIAFRTKINVNRFTHPETFPDYFSGILTRYHAIVLATILGIPFVAIAYDDKIIYLAKQLQQPCLDARRGHIDYNTLISMFNQIKSNYSEYVNRIYLNRNNLLNNALKEEDLIL